eukprot:TRINITY_DN4722_c0_g1_i1.p1 TRINITY_DN4722_c0_g1~~TRINITY_DN4722_c0_g1_i1.p1  ORF type:complete len:1338 (-),score=356.76 TRINITY_DN4722_c0_g1_i1:238-4086(-)
MSNDAMDLYPGSEVPLRPGAPSPSPRGGERAPRGNHTDADAELERGQDGGDGRSQPRPPPERLSGGRHSGRSSEELAYANNDWSPYHLPPCADHEVDIEVKDALSYTMGQSVRSNSKTVGNFRFRLLVFPCGTHSAGGQQVGAFVEADPLENLDSRWLFQGVKYQITLVNWISYKNSVNKTDTWNFSKDGIDRGWHDMVKTSDLTVANGWLGPGESLWLRASCYVKQADSMQISNDYNIRKETGHIGLLNHGATCYMNGLLQSLFHVGEFRRIVYSLDTTQEETTDSPTKDDSINDGLHGVDAEDSSRSPPLIQALQNVFYRLQTADQAVNCRELMKSFGWDTVDAFTQHDAQELNRLLCDRLEEQMKGTNMDGSIKRLFEGEMENYIECIDVDYKSRRNETFYDLQLNIKGERGQELRNVEESLKDFTAEETLEGDNAYEAEGHGKQRANKGIRFVTFPPVLNLQLKRFHFDLEKMDMVKLNTRFEFPRRLDLSNFAQDAGTYLLHAVVVHSGDVNSGHYYAHIRPTLENIWFKFDDDTVTPCSEYAAIDANFGGNDLVCWNYYEYSRFELETKQTPVRPRIYNAYMLVYIREDCAAEVLKVPDPRTTNPRMVDRYEREVRIAEQRRKEKIEQQLKIRVKLSFERDIRKMTGFWDHAEIKCESGYSLKMGRDQMIKELGAQVEALTGMPAKHLVFFVLQYRQTPRQTRFIHAAPNTTFRTHIPQFNSPCFDVTDPYLTMLCVASQGYDIQSLKWTPTKEGQKPEELSRWDDGQATMLIVKYFCKQNKKIVTLGCCYTTCTSPLISMVQSGWVQERLQPYLDNKEVAPIPQEPEGWQCWEEFSKTDIQFRTYSRSIKAEQLWSGDVIVWQVGPEEPTPTPEAEATDVDEAPTYPLNNVLDLANYLNNTVDVQVVVHDAKQPLCVDGVASTGHWGPPRPQSTEGKKEPSTPKEERPEDLTLQLSPAKFHAPLEQELKMDSRWRVAHVIGAIARAFNLKLPPFNPSEDYMPPMLLFQAAPSTTADEPLNSGNIRNDSSFKEVQNNIGGLSLGSSSQAKKQLVLHAVTPFGQAAQNCVFVCLRYFDDAVREVGSEVIQVPQTATMADVLAEAKRYLQPEWGITGPLRVLEVGDSRDSKLFKPEHPVRSHLGFGKQNIFFNCLRVEADPDSASLGETAKLVEIFHCDRASQQAFGQPFLMAVEPGEKSGSLKARCKAKLKVPDAEFKSWRLVRLGKNGRTHLKDDEAWHSPDAVSVDLKLCLEHVHPNPSSCLARQSRHNKPLMIK